MQARRDLPQLGLRRPDRRPRRQPRVDVGHPVPPLVLHRRAHVVIVGRVVDVEVLLPRRRVVRARLEHPDNQRLLDRQVQDLSDDRRIRPEHPLPVAVGEHRDRLRRPAFVRGQQHPPEMRPRAEQLEEVRRDQSARRPMRLAATEDVEGPVPELDELVDGLRLRAVVRDLDEREAGVFDSRRHLRLPQVHDAVGLGVGQRPQQDPVDDAEDRGVGANAEPERQDEGEREPRHPRQGPQREANVIDHGRLLGRRARGEDANRGGVYTRRPATQPPFAASNWPFPAWEG